MTLLGLPDPTNARPLGIDIPALILLAVCLLWLATLLACVFIAKKAWKDQKIGPALTAAGIVLLACTVAGLGMSVTIYGPALVKQVLGQ